MKYEPADKSRSARNSTCEKRIIVFEFRAQHRTSHLQLGQCHKDLYSQTVVVVTHSNQKIDCFVTLFWDDYYRLSGDFVADGFRFTCRDETTIEELIANVSSYFHRETARPLTKNNQLHLLAKVSRRLGFRWSGVGGNGDGVMDMGHEKCEL